MSVAKMLRDKMIAFGFAAGAQAENSACVQIAQAAGCSCDALWPLADFSGEFACSGRTRKEADLITRHDSRCPESIAQTMQARCIQNSPLAAEEG